MRVVILSFVVIAGCGHSNPTRPAQSSRAANSIIHEPSGGCPPESTRLKDLFTERDGSKESACQFQNGDGSIDLLKGGESMPLMIELQPSPTQQGKI